MGENLMQEFQGAKKPEKVVIVLGGVAVVGIGIYLYMKSQASGTPASASQTASGTSTGASGLPTYAPGTSVLSDANGNPLGIITPPVTTPSTPSTPGTSPLWFTNILGTLAYGTKITPGGVDPLNGQRFWTSKSTFFYAPVGSTIAQGSQGRQWLQMPGQTHQLLTGPGMLTAPTTSIVNTASAQVH